MIFLSSLILYNTFSFLTRSVQLIFSILLQHHISKLSRYVVLCTAVKTYRHFREITAFVFKVTLKMKALPLSKTFIYVRLHGVAFQKNVMAVINTISAIFYKAEQFCGPHPVRASHLAPFRSVTPNSD
jgi:hypothetical protein